MARLVVEREEPVRALVRGQLVVSLLRIVRESVAPQNRLDRLGQVGRLLFRCIYPVVVRRLKPKAHVLKNIALGK